MLAWDGLDRRWPPRKSQMTLREVESDKMRGGDDADVVAPTHAEGTHGVGHQAGV